MWGPGVQQNEMHSQFCPFLFVSLPVSRLHGAVMRTHPGSLRNVHAGSCSVPGVSQVPALRFSGLWWVRCRFSQQGALLPTLTVLLGPACVHPFIHSYLCSQNKQLLLNHLITSHGGDRAIPLGAGRRMLSWKACSD